MRSIGVKLAGVAMLAVTGPLAAQTQDAASATQAAGAQGATETPSAETAAPADGEIVVTGSRIARPDYAAPNPIVSYNAANIEQSGNTNLTNFLARVPALTNSINGTQSAGSDRFSGALGASSLFGSAGLNLLDLRGLGPNRTLVLVNGRRHVAGQFSTAAVDINAIPTDLVERVDVLTGGASAVYGADGVSGVVNFVLKRDFEGITARSQIGISERGDGGNRFASIQAGQNFAEGRGNVTLSYEYSAEDRLAYGDRSYLSQQQRRYLINNDADPNDDPNIPDNVLQGDLRYPGESPYGVISIGNQLFRGDGAVYDPGRPVSFYATGGDATPVAGFVGDLLPRLRRHAVNLLTHYDFSDAAKLSLEGKFVQIRARTFDSYSGDYPAELFVDNPLMPASIRNAAIAAGQRSVFSTRDNFDFPRKGEDDRRRTYRGVADLTGAISDHATYDISYTYGRTDIRIDKLNDRWNDRMLAALDVVTNPATGQPVCRSNLNPAAAEGAVSFTPGANSGCVPLNLFGINTASPEALAFVINGDNRSSARVTQQVVSGSVTGDFGQFFELPGGPAAFSFGGEYRRETSRFRPNGFLTGKQWYQYDEGNSFDPTFIIAPSSGKFDVWEVFGEVNAPILKDVPFAETLSVGAQGRYSDYSTVGSTKAYQFNAVYAPVRDVTFRGSYGESVRAPNIGELFNPVNGASSFFDDPCYANNRNSGTQFRNANCLTLIRQLGGNPATFTGANNPDAVSFISGQQSGNPNLREETARTWTAGTVLRPSFIPGLTIAADWYDIKLKNAISQPGAQTIAELCVDQPSLDNVFCSAIRRRQGTGFISGFTVQPQNVASYRTAGLDLNVSYQIRTASAGSFDLRFVGGYLDRLDIIATPGAQVEDQVEQPNRPKFNAVFSPTWTLGGLSVAYNLRYQDRQRRFAKNVTDTNPDIAPAGLLRYKELWQHDLQVQYALDNGFAFYVGVTNLTDQKPDVDTTDNPISPLGRFLYAGARVKLR